MNAPGTPGVAGAAPATVEQLASELTVSLATAERALAAEQARSHGLDVELAAAKQRTEDVLSALESTRRELHLQRRVPFDLVKLSKRAPVRLVMWLTRRLRRTAS